jgi:hypothetical protein
MSWLGGTVRRWIALVSVALTAVGVGALAAQAGRDWAWLAIGGMFLLVVSVGWTARDEHNKRLSLEERDPRRTILAKAIADGHVIVALEYPPAQHGEWNAWREAVYARLRDEWGLGIAHAFAAAGNQHRALKQAISAEVAYLEKLRDAE